MMKTPSEFELDQLMHEYDPKKAHEYYLRTRELKGRQKAAPKLGSWDSVSKQMTNLQKGRDPRTGLSKQQISKNARAKQRKELAAAIQGLESRLQKLEALIKKRIHEDSADNRKSKAKKERAAKESTKPQTAAEKAKANRENAQYRDKHKQELKTKAKAAASKSGGSSSKSSGSSSSKHSIAELHSLANKVRGQISVAKHKLAAL